MDSSVVPGIVKRNDKMWVLGWVWIIGLHRGMWYFRMDPLIPVSTLDSTVNRSTSVWILLCLCKPIDSNVDLVIEIEGFQYPGIAMSIAKFQSGTWNSNLDFKITDES